MPTQISPSGLTLVEIEKLNGRDMEVDLIEDVLTEAPEVRIVPTRIIDGTMYKAVRRTALPAPGSFRKANGGVRPGVSTLAETETKCLLYSQILTADPAVLNAGRNDSEDQLKAMEQAGAVRNAFIYLGKQFYYGVSNDPLGFSGVGTMINTIQTIDASGGTNPSNDGKLGTVFGVKFGPQFLELIWGNLKALQFAEWFKTLAVDPNDVTKYLTKWASQLDSWIGLSNGSPYAVSAIYNLNCRTPAQGGPQPSAGSYIGLTDDNIADLEATMPVSIRPDAYLMSRATRRSLQRSRSKVAVSTTGKRSTSGVEITAPVPTETIEGIPIIVTDSILDQAFYNSYL